MKKYMQKNRFTAYKMKKCMQIKIYGKGERELCTNGVSFSFSFFVYRPTADACATA
jgi:hypothetical protein